MSLDLLATVLSGLAVALAGLAAPAVLRRLREPKADSDSPAAPTLAELANRPRLGWRLAALGAPVGVVVGWQVGSTPVLAAWTYLAAVCLLLGYIDFRTRFLPTQLIAPSYGVLVVLLAAAAIADRSLHEVWGAGLGWAAMGGFYLVMWWFGPGLGFGDVRLAGLLALCLGFLGWGQLVTGLYAGFLLGGVASAVLLVARRATLKTMFPFGPIMMLGALAGLVWGHSLSDWYVTR